MFNKKSYIKLFIAASLVLIVHLAMGAFSGDETKKNEKFTLKHLNNITKNYSLSTIKTSGFVFRGSQELNSCKSANSFEINSFFRYQNGNTTYVFPYKYIFKSPRFAVPVKPKN